MSSRTIGILERLVSFDTTSRSSNLDLIQYVESVLAEHGVPSRRIPDGRDRVNLLATIGDTATPGLLMGGHTDVVPVAGQTWRSEPFELTRRDDRLYGRGSADMKGYLAALLAALPEMTASPLRMPITLAFTYDEEIGCVGIRDLLDVMETLPVKPRWAIIGEPTGMQVVTAHKGKVACRVTVTGREGHSSNPDAGVNAIDVACDAMDFIRERGRACRYAGASDQGYAYPWSSFHVGRISGGTAVNIIPGACWFDFEIRNLPEDDGDAFLETVRAFIQDELRQRVKRLDERCDVQLDVVSSYPGLSTDTGSELVAFAADMAGNTETGKVAFGTEAGMIQTRLGTDCVVCGPGYIAQAHQPDEFVEVEQLDRCDRFLRNVIGALRQ